MKTQESLFEEKQYLGYNRSSILLRTLIALFCFLGYYWSENPKPIDVSGIHIGSYPVGDPSGSGRVFFVLGILTLLLSVAMVYVLHIQTQVFQGYILLSGFWGSRKVKIDLGNILSVKKYRFKPNFFRRSVYNLHSRGVVKFYTSGDEFVELKDKDGFTYLVGSGRSPELFKLIKDQIQ